MPEGHTIHRAARDHAALFAGKRLAVDSPQGRFDEGAAILDGRVLRDVRARGKHLLYDFGGLWLHVHLGLFGRFRSGNGGAPAVQGAIRVRFQSRTAWLECRGPIVCEVLDDDARAALERRLGPDPLRATSRPAAFLARAAGSDVPVGRLVMDQSIIGGIGNVYRSELLFRAGIHPLVAARDVEPSRLRALWRDARSVLRAGVEDRRMITTLPRDRRRPDGPVGRDERFYVYHRTGKPCRRCGTPIEEGSLVRRRVFWCPVCQPSPA